MRDFQHDLKFRYKDFWIVIWALYHAVPVSIDPLSKLFGPICLAVVHTLMENAAHPIGCSLLLGLNSEHSIDPLTRTSMKNYLPGHITFLSCIISYTDL